MPTNSIYMPVKEHSSHQHIAGDTILELNGKRRAKNEAHETRSAHSGGNLIDLSPGVRITLANRWNLYTSLSIPVLDDSNGTQVDVDCRTNFIAHLYRENSQNICEY